MQNYIVSGIQQIGIGVSDLTKAWKWYREAFGINCGIFEDKAVANLMLPHTGGEARSRHAVLAYNLQGGGGFEVWQYTGGEPKSPGFTPQIGDLGIFACKIKSNDIDSTISRLKGLNCNFLAENRSDPVGNKTAFIRDPYGNIFQIIPSSYQLLNEKSDTGGVHGVIIGVTDIDKARKVYSDILGYDKVIYDVEGEFDDLKNIPGGSNNFRRVLLDRKKPFTGSFSRLLGDSQIELIEVKNREPVKIFKDRYWGDKGFMHLCYDISGMERLRDYCDEKGFPFSVDSSRSREGSSFDMGEAAGHFAYISDPDGTLIEFVETHKIPIIKKIGWYINLRKRNPNKQLPLFFFKALRFSRVK